MDLALIKVNWKTNTLQYAGANNPVYIVRHGKLDFIKANKMPIGIHDYENLPFTCHERSIEKGNMIYLFSDGYVDQFGGPVGKKFMSKNFKLLLEKISDEPLAEQRAELEKQFNTWKADEDQVDDVLVIGLRI
jgi:serine phosphatase RsbU (regulator of sigma subunit)